ncbi:MAG: pyridoxamine 5'-phosphate oxidase [Polyangiaceae bacterium]|nr:pyridoxamine 5'-phosphate oxidase [Polyangiaceae bacterium]
MNIEPAADPLAVFEAWYAENARTRPKHPDAMALATATPDGRPSLRMVLLKGVTDGLFRFFTNFESRKAVELEQNPNAALLFHWPALERQVRVEGKVQRLPARASDEYFATRPRESQLSALISPQSRPISRQELIQRRASAEARLSGAAVPRPAHWGGYALDPERIELWVAEPSRLHHRHLFLRAGAGWRYQVLGP